MPTVQRVLNHTHHDLILNVDREYVRKQSMNIRFDTAVLLDSGLNLTPRPFAYEFTDDLANHFPMEFTESLYGTEQRPVSVEIKNLHAVGNFRTTEFVAKNAIGRAIRLMVECRCAGIPRDIAMTSAIAILGNEFHRYGLTPVCSSLFFPHIISTKDAGNRYSPMTGYMDLAGYRGEPFDTAYLDHDVISFFPLEGMVAMSSTCGVDWFPKKLHWMTVCGVHPTVAVDMGRFYEMTATQVVQCFVDFAVVTGDVYDISQPVAMSDYFWPAFTDYAIELHRDPTLPNPWAEMSAHIIERNLHTKLRGGVRIAV